MPLRNRARVVTAMLVLLAACGSGAIVAPSTAVAASAPGSPTGSLTWHPCSGDFQCSTLTVPLDSGVPGGATLPLAVIRQPARKRSERIGSLVFNPGGPGAPAVSFLTTVADSLPGPIRDRFDLVAFDPRGVGGSRPIECVDNLDSVFDQSFQPTTAAARASLVAAVTTLADACAARNGSLLGHVATVDAVHDLERLRVALGESRLSFVGSSYGTLLGAEYASMYPRRVRAFVLDGPIDPAMTASEIALAQARGFEGALDDFLASCSSRVDCAFHHDGDAESAYDALRARTAESPIPDVRGTGRALNQTRFDAAVLAQLYSGRADWETLATALADAGHGNPTTLLEWADAFVGRDAAGRSDHAAEAFWAISCLDGPALGDVKAAAVLETRAVAIAPRLGAFIVNFSLPCSVWAVPPVATPGPLVTKGAPPILVIGTTRDPATPLAQAKALAAQLDPGVLLVARGDQHTSFNIGNVCVDGAVTRYLVALQAPRRGTAC